MDRNWEELEFFKTLADKLDCVTFRLDLKDFANSLHANNYQEAHLSIMQWIEIQFDKVELRNNAK